MTLCDYTAEQRRRAHQVICSQIVESATQAADNNNNNDANFAPYRRLDGLANACLERGSEFVFNLENEENGAGGLFNMEGLGDLAVASAALDFNGFNYSFANNEADVPLQDFVNVLRNFDQNDNEFRLTLEGVNLEQPAEGAGELWYCLLYTSDAADE